MPLAVTVEEVVAIAAWPGIAVGHVGQGGDLRLDRPGEDLCQTLG